MAELWGGLSCQDLRWPFTYPPTRPSTRPYIHPSIYPFSHPPTHHPSVYPPVSNLSIRISICPSTQPHIHPSVYLSTHPSIRITPEVSGLNNKRVSSHAVSAGGGLGAALRLGLAQSPLEFWSGCAGPQSSVRPQHGGFSAEMLSVLRRRPRAPPRGQSRPGGCTCRGHVLLVAAGHQVQPHSAGAVSPASQRQGHHNFCGWILHPSPRHWEFLPLSQLLLLLGKLCVSGLIPSLDARPFGGGGGGGWRCVLWLSRATVTGTVDSEIGLLVPAA